MPSHRVNTSEVSLSRFDVVGTDGEPTQFVSHAGLAESAGTQNTDAVKVLDMGPPLHGPQGPGQMQVSAVGCAELTDDEERKIEIFVQRHANEHAIFQHLSPRQVLAAAPAIYSIHPHALPLLETDGRYTRTRFSCAGFVFEAYKAARIVLLELNALPMVKMAFIRTAYPDHFRLVERGRLSLEDLGLRDSEPWPVLLCGYLFHALNRDADVIRQQSYVPGAKDQFFPSR